MATTSISLASVALAPSLQSRGPAHSQRADRRVRRLRLIGVVGDGDGKIGFEVGSQDTAQECRMNVDE